MLIASMFKRWTWWNTLYLALAAVMIAIGSFALCNVTMIPVEGERFGALPIWIELGSAGISILAFSGLIVASSLKKHYKCNYLRLAVFGIFFILGVVSILIVPKMIDSLNALDGEGLLQITPELRIISIAQWLILFLNFYAIVEVLPKIMNGISTCYFLAFGLMTAVSVFCIYSYIAEFEKYKEFFTDFVEAFKRYSVMSFFPNGNAYAIELCIGIFASIYLHNYTGKWWWLFPGVFFLLNIPFTCCRAVFIIIAFFTFAYWIYRFIITMRKHWILNVVTISVVVTLIGAGIAVIFLVTPIKDFIVSYWETGIEGLETFSGRGKNWEAAINLYKLSDWRFGTGYNIFAIMQTSYFGADNVMNFPCHNGFLEALCSGGVFFFTFFIAFYISLYFKAARLCSYDIKTGLFSIILLTTTVIYSIFESGRVIFPSGLEYVILAAFIWLPVQSKYAHIGTIFTKFKFLNKFNIQ